MFALKTSCASKFPAVVEAGSWPRCHRLSLGRFLALARREAVRQCSCGSL